MVEVRGEAHEQQFQVECVIPELAIRTQGEGPSRRSAEQSAARLAYEVAAESLAMHVGRRIAPGYIALVGRPNVGKSTLLNRLVGQKISITSRRPQTTRHRMLGIVTRADAQFVFVDTPGLQARHGSQLNRAMNRAAAETLGSVDAIVLVIEALRFGPEDKHVLAQLPAGAKVVLAINKVDRVDRRERLLPFLQQCSQAYPFAAIVPVSAKTGQQTASLLDELAKLLPQADALYGEDEITDRSERFLAAELMREKLFRLLGDEVPYATAVEIEGFEVHPGSNDAGGCAGSRRRSWWTSQARRRS